MSSKYLTFIFLFSKFPFLSIGSELCAILAPSSSSADRYTTLSVTLCVFWSTTLYGVSTNPYSFIMANDDSADISPMFGPSGDSIGHSLP